MLVLVPTPIGNIGDISIRALESFNNADIVLCEDTRVTKRLFYLLAQRQFVKEHFPLIDSDKKCFLSFHSHNQDEFLSKDCSDIFSQNVIYCTDAGMPCISDPGSRLIEYAKQNNIEYDVLPGASAFSLAFVRSGLEGKFSFIGFLPANKSDRHAALCDLTSHARDFHLIFYESPKRLKDSLLDMRAVFPNATIYVYKELTKLHECEYSGDIGSVIDSLPTNIKGEYCVIMKQYAIDNGAYLRLNQDEILSMPINIKLKAKMLAKVSNISAKEWYAKLLDLPDLHRKE